MKLLIDMNLSPGWVSFLAQAGIQAEHWSALGPANASDARIMAHARTEGYVVFTHDLDFSAILAATGGDKPSVVQLRTGDVSPGAIGATVVQALRQMETALDQGALLTIDPVRSRLRLLPLPAI
jgi:predicted nuclease of predicted toxin-antitoxin system